MFRTTCAGITLLLGLRLAAQVPPVPPLPACPIPAPAPSGEIWCLGPDNRSITGYGPSGNLLRQVRLGPIPEAATARVSPSRDLVVDARGNFHIPALWRESRTGPLLSGVFLFDPAGSWTKTVIFDLSGDRASLEVRHIAIDDDGSIIALGYRPGPPESCFLLHRFSPDGQRLGAFFPCPTLGPAQILAEITASRIFTAQSRVYLLWGRSKNLTVFDQFGRQFRP